MEWTYSINMAVHAILGVMAETSENGRTLMLGNKVQKQVMVADI